MQDHCYEVCFVQTQAITVVCLRSAVSTVTYSKDSFKAVNAYSGSTRDGVIVSLWFRKQWTSQRRWPSQDVVSAQGSPSLVHKRTMSPPGVFLFFDIPCKLIFFSNKSKQNKLVLATILGLTGPVSFRSFHLRKKSTNVQNLKTDDASDQKVH